LVSFDGARFTSLNPTNGFPNRAVRAVLADPEGGVWAATAGSGLARVQRGQVSVWGVDDGLPTDQLTSLSRDANGSLWIGTWGAGLCRFRDGKFSSISTPNGLAGSQLWCVYADHEGNIWVGTWVGGLNRLRDREFLVLGTPEGLSHDNVRAVIHARDGAAWVTTGGGGVNRITSAGITVIRQSDGLPSDEASTIMEDRDGAIWVGTYTAGLARLKDGRIETFGLDEGVPNVDVREIYQDRSGTIWAGTMSGLATFNGKGFTAVRAPGAPPEGASVILEDRSGTLWFGTNDGLARYRDGRFETLRRADGLLSNWIMSLYEDADGALWIGTNGEGLNRLKNGRLCSVRAADGLWDPLVQVILEDHFGNFWITCNRGFYRVRRKDLDAFCDGQITKVTSVGYGPGDALRSTTFAGGLQPAGAIDSEGHLWLPSFSGLVLVDPADLPGSGEPPSVILEQVLVNGVERPLDGPIVLPPGSAPLSITYTSTTLRVADRVRFRYRMEGSGVGWVDAGRNREAFFPTLPHGRYLFRVAASIDGVHWREIATPLNVTVKPHVYETPWFLALAILALVGLVVGVMKWRTRSLRRQKAEMERLVQEKTEELRRVNEHLSELSFVDPLTGLANRRRFDEALEQEWQRARRFGTPVSVVVADVDLFKPFNDTLGHPEGDKCLAAVGDVLLHTSRRAGDLVARYGGEEFIVLVPGVDKESVVTFAEALRAACEARAIPHPASDVAPIVTISLGVATKVPADGVTARGLVAEADAALYRAKREGRNRVCS
ncbi:MAG: diguanylate cyclase, partial [Thermoanaerobaculia bacterium]